MAQAKLVQVNGSEQQYAVEGELTMQTVPEVARDSAAMIKNMHGEVTINLAQVSRADSAALVLLVDWIRSAEQNSVSLQFEALPKQLIQIAKVSELHQILPINPA